MIYQILLEQNMKMQASSFNKSILTLVDEITSDGNAAIYIQPRNSKYHLSTNYVTSTLEYALAKNQPSIATRLKKMLFFPSLAPAPASQVLSAPDFVIRSTSDEETEIMAKIGKAKFALYHVGGVLDFLAGKSTNIAYPVLPKTVQSSYRLLRLGEQVNCKRPNKYRL